MTRRSPAFWIAVGAVSMLLAVSTCMAVAITVEHDLIVRSQLDER